MNEAFELLRLVQECYGGKPHKLWYSEGRPTLTIFLPNGMTQDLYFDEADFTKSAQALFDEVQSVIGRCSGVPSSNAPC